MENNRALLDHSLPRMTRVFTVRTDDADDGMIDVQIVDGFGVGTVWRVKPGMDLAVVEGWHKRASRGISRRN